MEVEIRVRHAESVAEHYLHFVDFAEDGMRFLGFPLTDMQADISQYMQDGPRLRMVMAQRGEAKSTLAALYAVWRIIQRPQTRVLIVSGGEKQASEVATLVIRLITTWEILEYLRPDKQAGDRSSVEAFDVHYSLKGIDKSPSVACVGITANLPGKRADLLIPDDIETNKNSMTTTERAKLMQFSKEFSSICTHGDILYLGTPQSKDSVYNTLPGRGFQIRIWPGRYPTPEEVVKYGDRLAPYLLTRIQADPSLQTGGGIAGDRGQPADPQRYTEEDLVEKELDKGPEDFSLQHMLDTSLSDAARQQLKLSDFLVANFDWDAIPEMLPYQAAEQNRVQLPRDFQPAMTIMYHPVSVPCAFVKPTQVMMFLDPAGGGGDEIGCGVSTAIGPYIHALYNTGWKGGLTDENANKIAAVVKEYGVTLVKCESNMGHGLFEINLRAHFEKLRNGYTNPLTMEVHEPDPFFASVGVVGEYSTGQKERRIIDSMVSAMQRHRVVLHKGVFDGNAEADKQHSSDKRSSYNLFQQVSAITTDRASLQHDDRIEALAGAIRHWKHVLVQDEKKAAEARRMAAAVEHMADPMGYGNVKNKHGSGTRAAVQRRRSRH